MLFSGFDHRPQKRVFLWPVLVVFLISAGCFHEPPARTTARKNLARWEDQRYAPEDSLLALINNEDAHVRLMALRSAGLIGRRNVTGAMIDKLADPSETVARQSATSLGLLGDPTAVPALEALLTVPGSRLRRQAVAALGLLPNQGHGLLMASRSDDPREAALAWDGLRNMAARVDSIQLATAISEGLARGRDDVLWRVLHCAERLPDARLIPQIAPHVRSLVPQVRVQALRALGHQDQVAALEALLRSQQDEPSFHGLARRRILVARYAALGSLAHLGFASPQALAEKQLNLLVTTLIEGAGATDPQVAATALAAMEKLALAFALPPEAATQESLLPVWRIRLARAAHSHLEGGLLPVRGAAIRAWSALRGQGSLEQLHALLSDHPDPVVQQAVLHALAHQGPASLPILSQFTRPKFRAPVQVAALTSLEEIDPSPDQQTVCDLLAQAAADTDFTVAATALGFLGKIPSRQALIALTEAWDTPYREGNSEVRRAVLAALKEMGAKVAGLKEAVPGNTLPDNLLNTCAQVLREGFDSPDLRIRLESRAAAVATGLLPATLIPTENSLRETVPPWRRSPRQPAVRTPFPAPRVRGNTARGSFVIKLRTDLAPNTCAMFLDLIEKGFYDGLTFHRVVPDFVVQGGDPRGDGWGGPGYTIRSEWSSAPFKRGTVGIAHDGKDSGGSQFFVTLSEQPHLNGRYTVFGEVVKGLEVFDRIGQGDTFSLEILP